MIGAKDFWAVIDTKFLKKIGIVEAVAIDNGIVFLLIYRSILN